MKTINKMEIPFHQEWLKKLLRIMKITTLLCFLVVFRISATVYSQDKTFNLDIQEKTVKEILDVIEDQSKFRFFYNDRFMDLNRKVNLYAKKSQVTEILKELFEESKVTYKILDNNLIVITPKDNVELIDMQQIIIKGKVTDANGGPLPGVNIVEKGTTNGAVSDIDGNYSISVSSANSVLIFSFVGYLTDEIEANGQTTLDVVLVEDIMSLDEVVVIGYGTMKKSDLTGAVGVADVDDILKTPSFNALQGMKGKLSGVNIFQNSGSPTGSPRVVIRGMSSINSSTDPLYVVDGVIVDNIKYLNPSDIERLEVLKDASASAIYGTRGSNGVVMITTKGGLKSDGISVSYNGYMSVGKLRKKMDVMNAAEYMEVLKRGYANAPKYDDYAPGEEPVLDLSDPRLFNSDGTPIYDTDWQEEATRTAFSHNHQLNIQQGSEKSSMGAFLNYSDNEGIMLNSWMKRLNARLTYDVDATDWLSLGVKLNTSRISENEPEEGGGYQMPRRTMIEMIPILPVKFPDGNWSSSVDAASSLPLEGMANPVHVLKTQDRLRYRTINMGNFNATIHLTPSLDFKTQFGVNSEKEDRREYSPTDLQNISFPNGWSYISSNEILYWQEETYLSFNKTLNEHRISAVAGTSFSKRQEFGTSMRRSGFSDNITRFYNIDGGATADYSNSGYNDWSIHSYFARGNYALKDRYMVTVTGRMDGSSRFGANNKYAFFPSVGLGWVASEESFLSGASLINYLKFRASYGITGNTDFAVYQSLATVQTGTSLMNGEEVSVSYISRLPNKDLEWEKTSQLNVGFNAEILNNRIALEFDYYTKYTSDLLLARPVPLHTGFGSIMDNIGSVSNRGVDILFTSRNVNRSDFTWETILNLNFNKNKIEELGENDEDILQNWWVGGDQNILRVGESLSSFYGYTRYGCYSTEEAAADPTITAGVAKRSDGKDVIGNGIPVWTGSFINNFSYKNFDLTVDLQFVYDVDILQQFYHSTEDRTGIANGLKTILYDSWTENNQGAMVQQIRHQGLSGQNSYIDTHWIADGSYLRGNLISLGYTFDTNVAKKLGLSGLRLYSSVSNAFVLHSDEFQGFDPEGTSQGDYQWGQGMMFFEYPKPRTFTFGVDVKF